MKKESIEIYIGCKVKVNLKNGNVYTLVINTVTEEDFSGIDKYDNKVTISNNEVSSILELEVRGDQS
jgi:hypothetical protein